MVGFRTSMHLQGGQGFDSHPSHGLPKTRILLESRCKKLLILSLVSVNDQFAQVVQHLLKALTCFNPTALVQDDLQGCDTIAPCSSFACILQEVSRVSLLARIPRGSSFLPITYQLTKPSSVVIVNSSHQIVHLVSRSVVK